MLVPELILKKRNGASLSEKEISFLVEGYTSGIIPDYQVSALLMAIYFKGLDTQETAFLTKSMMESGSVLDLSFLGQRCIDKHSTGGVGDKVSLALAPLVASEGVVVPMICGRGLGHTGGTLDKIESVPGFNTRLQPDEFLRLLKNNGLAIGGQTGELAPADRKLYALRDVTGTVDSIPLIAASIMSKKFAEGAHGFVFDVKVGAGAFMKDKARAMTLAETLVSIAKEAGRDAVAVLTDMNQPLGFAVGNALEVSETIDLLKGGGPADYREVLFVLASHMFVLGGRVSSTQEGRALSEQVLNSGQALEKFRQMIESQGGDGRVVDDDSILSPSPYSTMIQSDKDGFITSIDAYETGMVSILLGAGRQKSEEEVDPGAGIVFKKKAGDAVSKGEAVAVIYSRNKDVLTVAAERLLNACVVKNRKVFPEPLVLDVIKG
ncbi:MAG: thymidine phosphorylase [Candidatus Theseobacter exili]|nr:thymidine phosphorylase [Candidatus Theseobacter exili]